MTKPTNVDEYVAGVEGPSRTMPEQLRTLCGETAPEAGEAIRWGRRSVFPRRLLSWVSIVLAGVLVLTGCSDGNDDQAPDAPTSSAASSADQGPNPSTSASDESSRAGGSADPAQQNQALLDAGATAHHEQPDATVTSIDSERRDTMWEVELVDADGQEHTVGVSKDGKEVTSGPSSNNEDAEDRADNQRKVEAAEIDYEAAVSTIESERPGRIVELNLDEDDGKIVWEADVRDDNTKYEVQVDAESGDVLLNQVDRDD